MKVKTGLQEKYFNNNLVIQRGKNEKKNLLDAKKERTRMVKNSLVDCAK